MTTILFSVVILLLLALSLKKKTGVSENAYRKTEISQQDHIQELGMTIE